MRSSLSIGMQSSQASEEKWGCLEVASGMKSGGLIDQKRARSSYGRTLHGHTRLNGPFSYRAADMTECRTMRRKPRH